MIMINRKKTDVETEGKIQRLEAENAELKSRADMLEDALVEIAELIEGEPELEPEPEKEGGNE
jgi:hypothetical protein